MKFTKDKPRPANAGRKKGVKNKKTQQALDQISKVLSVIEKDHLAADIKALSPSQRTSFYANLIEYKHPKLSRTEVLADIKTDVHWNETKKYGTGTKAEPGT